MTTHKRIYSIVAAVLFIAAAAVTVYYIYFLSRNEFHSDCTDTMMWALASLDSGHVYSESFHYAALLPFGGNLLMMPFITLYGVTMKAHVLGMCLFFLLFVCIFGWMLRRAGWILSDIAVAESLFLAITLSSQKMREIFWGHVIYYSLGFILLLLLTALGIPLVSEKDSNVHQSRLRALPLYVCFFVFVVLTSMNGTAILALSVIPLSVGLFLTFFLNPNNELIGKCSRKHIILLLIIGIGVGAGIKLNHYLAKNITAGYADMYSSWSSMDMWIQNLQKLPTSWISLFGVQDLVDRPLTDISGLLNLLRITAAVIVALIPIIATTYYQRIQSCSTFSLFHLWVWIHWTITGFVLFGYICGKLSVANWRLTPILYSAVMLDICYLHERIKLTPNAPRLLTLVYIPVILIAVLNIFQTAKKKYAPDSFNELYQLSNILEERNLTYGYSTFWRSNGITVVSDSHVKIRSISINEQGIHPSLYQTDDHWYDNQPDQNRYFILCSEDEYATFHDFCAESFSGEFQEESISTYNGGTYTILLFQKNPVLKEALDPYLYRNPSS